MSTGASGRDRSARTAEGRPLLTEAQQVGPHRAGLLDHVASLPPADSGRPGHIDLQAAGVGHQPLASVHRPHVGRRRGRRQRPDAERLREHQAAATRVAKARPRRR